MAGLTCDIVTPQKKLFSDEATMVVVPGTEGEMGFLEGHVPLVSALSDGAVRVTNENVVKTYACHGGYVEVDGHKVIVLADRAALADDIDAAAVQSELDALKAKLEALDSEDPECLLVSDDIAWCETQLKTVGAE